MRFLDKYAARDKALLRLEREHNRLHRALHDAPVVPLETPYQRGWTKTYVLREDIRRRADVGVFRTVLAAVNRDIWSRTRDFVQSDGSRYNLRPRIIPALEWQRIAWTAAQRRLFTYGAWKDEVPPQRWLRRRRLLAVGFTIANPWWLEEELRPCMVTHRRADLPEVRGRLAEIDARMQHTRGWERLSHIHGHSQWWWRSENPRIAHFRADLALREIDE